MQVFKSQLSIHPFTTDKCSALEAMSSFLLPHLPMVNVCMVDFISDSLFERTVAPGIKFNSTY